MRIALPGEELTAPGVLRNPVRVEALWDPEASMEATLRNLLQRAGYDSIDHVREQGREEGREQGREEGLADAARRLIASGMTVDQAAAALSLDVAFVSAAVSRTDARGSA
jgi:hypothetical protein